MRLRKKILFTCVLILVAVTPLIVIELYVRATRPYVDLWVDTGRKVGPNPIKAWGFLDAYAAYRGRPGTYGTKTINSYGFISTPELTLSKPVGTIRIVFLGGSSTAGTGGIDLADEDTWPWQVSKILQTRFPQRNIEFINGALAGYTSFESYGRLWSRIRFFSPDIVVVYHGWNEMYYFDDAAKIITLRTLPEGDWTLDRTIEPIELYKPLAIDYLIRPSQALTHLRLGLTGPRVGEVGLAKPLSHGYDKRTLEIWRTNLRLLRETSKLIGAELFVAKQATLIVPDLPTAERARVRYEYHGFDHETHLEAYARIYQIIDEEIPAEHIIDVTPISGQPEYFLDHVHPTQAGASMIADIVANNLASYLQSNASQLSEKR